MFLFLGNLTFCTHLKNSRLFPFLSVKGIKGFLLLYALTCIFVINLCFSCQFQKSTIKLNAFQVWGQPEKGLISVIFGLCLIVLCNVKLKAITANIKKNVFCCKQVHLTMCICVRAWMLWQQKLISSKTICHCKLGMMQTDRTSSRVSIGISPQPSCNF